MTALLENKDFQRLIIFVAVIVIFFGIYYVFILLIGGLVDFLNKHSDPHRIGIPMQLFLYFIFAVLLYINLGPVAVGLFGEETTGRLTSISYNVNSNAEDSRRAGRKYEEWHYYEFTVDGKSYSGHQIYYTDMPRGDLQPNENREVKITYLPISPKANFLSSASQPDRLGAWGITARILTSLFVVFLTGLIFSTNFHNKEKTRR